MRITWRDEIGTICTKVDEYGVSFLDGFAVFSDGERDYKVPVMALEGIANEEV